MTGDRAAALVLELYEKSLIPSPADVFDALRTLQREAAEVAAAYAWAENESRDSIVRRIAAKLEAL